MNNLEEDPILGRFFDTPEKKARWYTELKLPTLYGFCLWFAVLFFSLFGI